MKTNRFISLLLCVVMIMSLFTGLAGSASADDVIVHEVQSGEIMLKICEKHGLNYYACKNAIMQLNGFTSETQLAKLSVGQKVKLPASDAVAGSVSTTTAVVSTTTVGGTTMTTTTSYVGTTAAGANIAYYLTAYTVQAGDTLAGICSKLGSNYYYYSPVILGINSLANANYIRPGQVLLIPTSTPGGAGYAVVAHQVQAGETTTSICNRYGVSYQAMRQLINGLNRRDNMDKIYPGQTVYVPTSVAAAASVVTTGTTTTTTTTGTSAASSGYTISFANSGAFASVNGKDYVTSAPAGSEVSVWSSIRAGYAVKSLDVVRLDTGAPVPVDYNYFTMPNSNVYVDVTYEKGLTITKAKAQGGSFETLVGGFLSNAAFEGDEVTILAYPNQYYSVKNVSYQKTDGTVTSVDVKKNTSGNYSFTMPNYPITVSVTFAPTQYHMLSYSGVIGNGKVTFTVGGKEVAQAEQGETITMKFVADKNWAFNTSDFENNLAAHIPNKSSMGSFKKVDDTTYTFVLGTKDINVVGIQFLNRSTYSITGTVWKNVNNATNGSIYFNVIDQTTGAITYKTSKAKFGDTVQVIYAPSKNYVNDAQYAKDNSKGAGNALLAWSSDNTFTMPDSNVTVNARFVQDGGTHTYSGLSRSIIPAAGGTIDFLDNGCVMETGEVGKVITVKITPKPNYDLSVAKVIGGNEIYAVSLNGKLVGDAPATSNFTKVDKYTYTFVKGAGTDTIRVAFASDYQGVNATFTQITEGGALVVQGIKGFAINGSYVQGDAQVIYGDTVSFTLNLVDGYEVTSVRKFIQDKSTSPATEIANTTAYIPGGKNNSYSYTVTRNDINAAQSVTDGELVFEITCRKNPETYYTVKYTTPKIDGKTPMYVDTTTPVSYGLKAEQISSSSVLRATASADISGISGNLVEANDVMIYFQLQSKDVYVDNPATLQRLYYTFDKLLLNGQEFTPVDSSSDPSYYLANFILPKDVADGIVTTEVVYRLYKTEDKPAIILKNLKFDSTIVELTDGVFDYSVDTTSTPQDITADYFVGGTATKPDSAEVWLNDVCLYTDDDTNASLEATSANWVTGPNKLVIKVHSAQYTDTTYNLVVNYGMEASELSALTVDGTNVTPDVTDPAHPAALTIYEVTTDKKSSTVALTSLSGTATVTWDLNGTILWVDDPAGSKTLDLNPGLNTLKLSVTESGKSPTTYVVNINCALGGAAEAQTITIDNAVNLPGGVITIVDGQLSYEALVNAAETSNITVAASGASEITAYINGNTDSAMTTAGTSLSFDTKTIGKSELYWQKGANTLMVTVKAVDKTDTTYTVKVNCNQEASELATLSLEGTPILAAGKKDYTVTAQQDTSTITLTSVSGTATVTYTVNGGTENTVTGTSFDVTWPQEKNNKVVIYVKEEGKTETTYTLTVTKKAAASLLEDYLIIDGDTVKFSSSRTASYTSLGKFSDVTVTLTPPPASIESVKLEVNGVLTDITPTVGTDAQGNVTYKYAGVEWKSGGNSVKVYVKYADQAETVYTVSLTSKADNLSLDTVTITGLTPNYKNGASGVKLYGDTDAVTATAVDPAANVTINVYGSTVMTPVTSAGTATVTGITWNTDGNESNRIDIIVESDGYSKTYSITGVYSGLHHP